MPPEAVAVKVEELPVLIDDGDAEQETTRVGMGLPQGQFPKGLQPKLQQ